MLQLLTKISTLCTLIPALANTASLVKCCIHACIDRPQTPVSIDPRVCSEIRGVSQSVDDLQLVPPEPPQSWKPSAVLYFQSPSVLLLL